MASYSASANLYNVEMVTLPTGLGLESYGSAIDETGSVAGDTRNGTDGLPFRDEAPFGLDNTFVYQDFGDIESYCYRQLGYNSCENWATREWEGINNSGGLEREREAYYWGYTANANGFDNGAQIMATPTSAYVPGGGTLVSGSNNVIVNKYSVDDQVMGTTSSGYYDFGNYGLAYRERGFVGTTILPPATTFNDEPVSDIVTKMGRTMAFDSFVYPAGTGPTYIVGSASVAPFDYGDGDKDYDGRDVGRCFSDGESIADPGAKDYCQNFAFSTKGFIWSSDGSTGISVATWNKLSEDTEFIRDQKSYMSSVRGAVVPNSALIQNEDGSTAEPTEYEGQPLLVGYNTRRDDNNLLMQASIFYPNFAVGEPLPTTDNQWTTKYIARAEVEDDGDYIYANTRATDINNNLLVIGESKRSGFYPENGAAANRIFVADAAAESPSATYLSETGESIFFSGSGGEAKAVNNYNEIVGIIDAETAREYNGKQRRHRGFINPYDFDVGTHTTRRALFQNRAWWLDDLTNDDDTSGNNNQFRIIAASDINDKGEIAATALYCAGGYDNTGHNAYCDGGTGTETVVAVKLVPTIDFNSPEATATITPRSVEQEAVERQGGSVAPWMLGLLGLIGLRRKLKK
ncbi:hypothetical protein VSU01S_28550 [Vibrio superstes NBRC 103154]|uniref:GlyGly-CTERM sorting domain-containing protein n=2 Tax=Vibrio superstes TaxID=198815 RepID=A0A511QTE9_9VIBR|nr:hypothetical protein VSU01S_28550 [Vibrio superstes NBRC 103154]